MNVELCQEQGMSVFLKKTIVFFNKKIFIFCKWFSVIIVEFILNTLNGDIIVTQVK